MADTAQKLMELLATGTPEQKDTIRRAIRLAAVRRIVDQAGATWQEQDGTITITATADQVVAMFYQSAE